jgi:DNA-directed RNA polymerase
MSPKSALLLLPRWVLLFWHPPLLRHPQSVLNEDGTPSSATETKIPFNLGILRKHLAHVSLARRVLSEDLAARQKLLEDSVYDVAVQRMRRQAELFKELGLGDSVLKKQDLQLWMWQWHQLLQARLRDDIALLIKEESSQSIWFESRDLT